MLRDVYAKKAISQIPRLLGNQDRNEFSPTYGCFHRDYWLDKTSDFPDAVRQFGVHSLALVYKYDFPKNIYKDNKRIRDWAIAGLEFWASIQHKDGSFDEFYPFERGWVGPTAFTTFTSIEAYNILKDEISDAVKEKVEKAIKRASYFIAEGDKEEDHLANHHAMACLALWKACRLLGDEKLKEVYERAFQVFLTYHNKKEGWSREYDGIDPGYLSATVSFFGKIYQENKDERILKIMKQSVDMCSYFAYPNGFYAGSMGSRNTLHFYPHGFEVIAGEHPMAMAVAEKMLKGLSRDKLVPPEIISDRYVFYRVPEFLQSYLDYQERVTDLPRLPHEQDGLKKYFDEARIFVHNTDKKHIICNLAKGGVVKVFDRSSGELIYNDCGAIATTEDGKNITSQWVDPSYKVRLNDNGWEVSGDFNFVPSNKLFTLTKGLIFRSILLIAGWMPWFSHFLKGNIRKILIMGQRKAPARFKRIMKIENNNVSIGTEVYLNLDTKISSLSIGGEFFVRYVPQSRYFQFQELFVKSQKLRMEEVKKLNKSGKYIKNLNIN